MSLAQYSDGVQYFRMGGALRVVCLSDLLLCRAFAFCLCLALKAFKGLGFRGYQDSNLGTAGASGVG